MRVLLANKFFYDHGGPETVLFQTRDLLQANGHDVIDFSMQDARNRPSPYASYFAPNVDLRVLRPTPRALKTALAFVDSREAAARLRRLVRDQRPDVAHLHSINHQLTPSIIRVLSDEAIPVVMTLHDYKLVCPAYTMVAGGKVCRRCAGGRYYRALTTGCRGTPRSALLMAESYVQHRLLRSYGGVALFLSPSEFLARTFAEMGFRHAVEVLPNPGPSVSANARPEVARTEKFLFVGRVAPEKGLATLVRAAVNAGVPLQIAGDGPQLDELRLQYGSRRAIEFLGRVAPDEVQALMRAARAVVVPSEWFENQPMVILEAFASGTPVIASALGGMPELVSDGETGLLYEAGMVDALAGRLRWAAGHPDALARMGEQARLVAARFGPDVYLRRLLGVYGRVTAGAAFAAGQAPQPAGGTR